jgi:hypothetical protein
VREHNPPQRSPNKKWAIFGRVVSRDAPPRSEGGRSPPGRVSRQREPVNRRRRQPSCDGASRMNQEVHVRICERLGMKFPGPTRQFRTHAVQLTASSFDHLLGKRQDLVRRVEPERASVPAVDHEFGRPDHWPIGRCILPMTSHTAELAASVRRSGAGVPREYVSQHMSDLTAHRGSCESGRVCSRVGVSTSQLECGAPHCPPHRECHQHRRTDRAAARAHIATDPARDHRLCGRCRAWL